MSQTHIEPDGGGSVTGTPRWVKVFGIIAFVFVVLFVILHLTGNSLGGPGSHFSHSGVTKHGTRQP